jgi:RNA polymerase sigma factor (sigma-70 family)
MTHSIGLHDDDAGLVARAITGDETAYATLYDRYFGRIHDFVLRIVRNHDAAADATQLAFVRAWQALSAGTGPATSTKSWLFAIARNAAIDETRRTSRLQPFDGESGDGRDERPWNVDESRFANPDELIRDSELAALVWRAASSLNPGDYALLDMHARQELAPEEIAEALAMKPGAVHTRLSRLRDALEEAVGADLLARAGRRDCPRLEQVLATVDIQHGLDRTTRKRVRRHLETCPECEETRRRLVSPVALFGAFAPLTAPGGLQAQLFERSMSAARAPSPTQATALVAAPRTRPMNRWGLTVASVAGVLLVLFVVMLIGRSRNESTAPPVDPGDVRSTTHQASVASPNARVEMAWSRLDSADGYSVVWDHEPRSLPDTIAELPGEATGVTTEALADGTWFFHLRTRNSSGKWTSTVHAGPFIVQTGGVSQPTSVPSLSPSPGVSSSPETSLTPPTASSPTVPASVGAPSPTNTATAPAATSVPTAASPLATQLPPTATSPAPTATRVPNLAPNAGPIIATLVTPVTTYTVIASDPEGAPLTYSWSWTGTCGVWAPTTGNSATWSHPNGSPPLACPHDSPSHPGSITVTISDGVNSVTRTYSGSLAGTGPP